MLYKLMKYCDSNGIYIHIDYLAGVVNLKLPKMHMGKYTIDIIRKNKQIDLDKTAEIIMREWGWDNV